MKKKLTKLHKILASDKCYEKIGEGKKSWDLRERVCFTNLNDVDLVGRLVKPQLGTRKVPES